MDGQSYSTLARSPSLSSQCKKSSMTSLTTVNYGESASGHNPTVLEMHHALGEELLNTQERCDDLSEHNKLLQSQLTLANDLVEKLETKAAELERQVSVHEDDLVAAVQRIGEQAEHNANLAGQLDSSQFQVQRLKGEVEGLKQEVQEVTRAKIKLQVDSLIMREMDLEGLDRRGWRKQP